MNRPDSYCHRSSEYYKAWAEKGTRRFKVGKLNRKTQMRIRFYEFKIQISDFCERIANSIHTSLLNKTIMSGNNMDTRKRDVSRVNAQRPKLKNNCKSRYASVSPSPRRTSSNAIHKSKFNSDREIRNIRRTLSNTQGSPECYDRYRRRYRDGQNNKEFGERKLPRRKQRSSLTKRKSTILDDQFDITSCKKRMGKGDTYVLKSRKSSSSDLCKRKDSVNWKPRENRSRTKQKYRKPSYSSRASLSSSTYDASDEELKSDNEEKIDVAKKEVLAEKVSNDPKEASSTPPPPQLSSVVNSLEITQDPPNAYLKDAKDLWKRLGSILLAKRKRPKDIDSLPPKLVKFGIQWNTHNEKSRKCKNRDNHDNSLNAPAHPLLHSYHQHRDTLTSKLNYPELLPSKMTTPQPFIANPEDNSSSILSRILTKIRNNKDNPDSEAPPTNQISFSQPTVTTPSSKWHENIKSEGITTAAVPTNKFMDYLPPPTQFRVPAPAFSRKAVESSSSTFASEKMDSAGQPAKSYSPQTEFTSQFKHLLASN